LVKGYQGYGRLKDMVWKHQTRGMRIAALKGKLAERIRRLSYIKAFTDIAGDQIQEIINASQDILQVLRSGVRTVDSTALEAAINNFMLEVESHFPRASYPQYYQSLRDARQVQDDLFRIIRNIQGGLNKKISRMERGRPAADIVGEDAATLRQRYEAVAQKAEGELEKLLSGRLGWEPFVYGFIYSLFLGLIAGGLNCAGAGLSGFSIFNAGITAAVVTLGIFLGFVISTLRWLNAAPTPEENAIRARKIRSASRGLFIQFYHLFYMGANRKAWEQTFNGAFGFWGLTLHVPPEVKVLVARDWHRAWFRPLQEFFLRPLSLHKWKTQAHRDLRELISNYIIWTMIFLVMAAAHGYWNIPKYLEQQEMETLLRGPQGVITQTQGQWPLSYTLSEWLLRLKSDPDSAKAQIEKIESYEQKLSRLTQDLASAGLNAEQAKNLKTYLDYLRSPQGKKNEEQRVALQQKIVQAIKDKGLSTAQVRALVDDELNPILTGLRTTFIQNFKDVDDTWLQYYLQGSLEILLRDVRTKDPFFG